MNQVYETDKSLHEYLLFHFGTPEQILPYDFGPRDALDFAVRTVSQAVDRERPATRALDLGCAVGRSSFELSKFVEEVHGIDYSNAFIDAANVIALEGSIAIEVHEEGARYRSDRVNLPSGVNKDAVSFSVGDAHEVDESLGSFNIVHAANLLCRLHTPSKLLERLPSLVNTNGQLILATPCTWLEEFTPRENWLGGAPSNQELTTLDSLQVALGEAFECVWNEDIPMLIRETSRKYQWTASQVSRWIRK